MIAQTVTVSVQVFLGLAIFAAVGVANVCLLIVDLDERDPGPQGPADDIERVILLPSGWTERDIVETVAEIEAL